MNQKLKQPFATVQAFYLILFVVVQIYLLHISRFTYRIKPVPTTNTQQHFDSVIITKHGVLSKY